MLNGTDVLAGYELDGAPRSMFAIGDSCVTFNEGNKTPSADGAGMSRAFSEMNALWKGRTLPLMVMTKDAAHQQEILTLLLTLISSFCVGDAPETFRGHLLLIFSPNDVKKGKHHVPPEKLEFTHQIIALLRRFPIGTVSIIGPGSEGN